MNSVYVQSRVTPSVALIPICTHITHARKNKQIKTSPATPQQHKGFRVFQTTCRSSLHSGPLCLAVATEEPSIQLATAKLPPGIDLETFQARIYSWASTITSSGQNMPFALPLRTRQIKNGFEIGLLRIRDGSPVAVGSIQATVEDIVGTGDVMFVRFVEGEGAAMVRNKPLPSDSQERLKIVLESLVDVPLIMGSMKTAIRQCVSQSGPKKEE